MHSALVRSTTVWSRRNPSSSRRRSRRYRNRSSWQRPSGTLINTFSRDWPMFVPCRPFQPRQKYPRRQTDLTANVIMMVCFGRTRVCWAFSSWRLKISHCLLCFWKQILYSRIRLTKLYPFSILIRLIVSSVKKLGSDRTTARCFMYRRHQRRKSIVFLTTETNQWSPNSKTSKM
jgi:hypothetical protein